MNEEPQLDTIANQIIEECQSTNDLAKALGQAGYPSGTWVAAKRQNNGRGRRGRSWVSREGNLFLSMLIRPSEDAPVTWFPLASTVAVTEALAEKYPSLNIQIKWPNDLMADQAKVGGVLCEFHREPVSFVVVGVGLNLASAPHLIGVHTASLAGLVEQPVRFTDIQPLVTEKLQNWVVDLNAPKKEAIQKAYQKRALLKPGTHVQWSDQESHHVGWVEGLGEEAELWVKLQSDERRPLYSEDVHLMP